MSELYKVFDDLLHSTYIRSNIIACLLDVHNNRVILRGDNQYMMKLIEQHSLFNYFQVMSHYTNYKEFTGTSTVIFDLDTKRCIHLYTVDVCNTVSVDFSYLRAYIDISLCFDICIYSGLITRYDRIFYKKRYNNYDKIYSGFYRIVDESGLPYVINNIQNNNTAHILIESSDIQFTIRKIATHIEDIAICSTIDVLNKHIYLINTNHNKLNLLFNCSIEEQLLMNMFRG